MIPIRTLVALSVAALAGACASTGTVNAPPPSSTAADASAAAPMSPMEPRMKAMQEMHQKMMNAKTPEERNALMADHMKAMQGGMSMMKGMGAMDGKGSMEGMGAMADAKGMPADMAKHHKMMEQRMTMMQMMMEMMMDRMPPASMKQ
ncbi:MAG: hypothetical protein HYX43_00375 [Burkholderiales bacterium]|nr:hypothetical protein [Burkholderiales bacterium]